jgi:ankyrin repeat protein
MKGIANLCKNPVILKGKSDSEIYSKLSSLSEQQINHLMIQAARNNLTSSIQLLLDYNVGINVNCRDEFRYTPLMLACIKGNYKIAELLVTNRANVNLKNKFGTTALMHAAFYGRLNIVRLLLKWGAKTDLNDRAHEYALDYCLRGFRHKRELGSYPFKHTSTSNDYNEIISLLTDFA